MQILVLGMHRSGTSMVARLLNMMGAYFAPEGVEMDQSTPNWKAVSSAGEQMTQMIDPQTKRYTALLTQQKIRARPTVKLSAPPASK
jgi:hypothetical protein